MPPKLTEAEISDVIQMALSDHVSFNDIRNQYGLAEKDVKKLMRSNLKPDPIKLGEKEFGILDLGVNIINKSL